MIKINRSSCPPVLLGSPVHGTRYNEHQVVDKLHCMQFGKCCYCEREIPKRGHGKEVDHFIPQSIDSGKRNDWNNLLLACTPCNGTKGNKYPIKNDGTPLLIDPTSNDPECHIDFNTDDEDLSKFALITEKNNSCYGKTTIKEIDLNKDIYRRERKRYYKEIYMDYCDILLNYPDKDTAFNASVSKLESRLSADSVVFTGFARAFAEKKDVHNKFGVKKFRGYDKV